jgi:hypothetical protein
MKTLKKSLFGAILIIGLVFTLSTPITSYACSPSPDAEYPTRQSVIDDGGAIFIAKILNTGPVAVANVIDDTSDTIPQYVVLENGKDSCSSFFEDFTADTYAVVVTPTTNYQGDQTSIVRHTDLDSQFTYFYTSQSTAQAAYAAIQNGENPEPENSESTPLLESHYTPVNYTLRPGMNNQDIMRLQSAMNYLGAGLIVDGAYGNGTQQAIMNFQNQNGLTSDGIAGNQTQQRLHERLGLTTE